MINVLPSLYLVRGRGIVKGEGVISASREILLEQIFLPYRRVFEAKFSHGFVTRKNSRSSIGNYQRISSLMAGMIADYGMVHSYTVVKASDPDVKARQLLNRWNGINTENIDSYLDEITEIHRLTCVISTNLEHTRDMEGVMPFLQGKYSKINGIIDCYNDYLKHNQFVQLKYKPLGQLDLSGVLIL